MNHQDKFWQAFQDKVKSYSTDEYSSTEWAAMEELLTPEATASSDTDEPAAAPKVGWMWWTAGLILLLAGGLVFWTSSKDEVLTEQYSQHPASTSGSQGETAMGTTAAAPPQVTTPTTASLAGDPAEDVAATAPPATSPPQKDLPAISTLASPSSTTTVTEQEQETTVVAPAATTTPSSAQATPAAKPTTEQALASAPAAKSTGQTTLTTLPAATPLPTSAIAPLTTAMPAAMLTQVQRAPSTLAKRWQPSLIVGGNLAPTDIGSTGKLAGGLMAGLAVRRNLNRRWAIEVEAVARAVTNFDLTLEVEDNFINPSGGQEFFHREVRTIEDYLSVDVPIVLHYATGSRWTLTTGLRYSYITPISTRSATFVNSTSVEVIARVREPQIWQNDFGLLFGVAYELSPKWSIQLRYTQSGVDLSPDNLYQDTKTHLNSDLQITTRKYF